jgi:hypothetical protein
MACGILFSSHHADGLRIEDQLQVHHLQKLMYWFQSHKPTPPASGVDRSQKFFVPLPAARKQVRRPGLLTVQELKKKLESILESQYFSNQLDNLINRVSINCEQTTDVGRRGNTEQCLRMSVTKSKFKPTLAQSVAFDGLKI